MQTSSALSLNDRVVSRCQLEGCELTLVKTSLGLYLKWQLPEGEGNTSSIASALLADNKTCGKLYPVKLNAELEKAVFGASDNSTSEQRGPKHALVMCNTGFIVCVKTKEPGVVFSLCHIAEPPVWCGALKAADSMLLVVVTKSGMVYIGQASGSLRISWFSKSLSNVVLGCCGHHDAFAFCDGFNSWICHLFLDSRWFPEFRCHKLPYVGIFKVTETDKDSVELAACDGRKYTVTWNALISRSKEEEAKSDPKSKNAVALSSIKETMMGIKKCSERMEEEGKHLHDLNLYIKQMNILSIILHDSEDVFSAKVRVEQQTIGQVVSYNALIEFTNKKVGFELKGKWWALCVSVPTLSGRHYETVRLDSHSFTPSCVITVPLREVDWNENVSTVAMDCALVLDHFDMSRPLCQVSICVAEVDILHFLTASRVLNKRVLASSNFTEIIKKLSKERHNNQAEKMQNKVSSVVSKVSTSFTSDERNVSLIKDIFSTLGCEISLGPKGEQVRLWYHEIPLDIHLCQQSGRILITFEGTKASLVLSAKSAIEGRIVKHRSSYTKLNLPPSVLRQARQSHRILQFESCKACTPTAVIHLHHMTTNVMSLLPL
ncbi:uncharacterized protein LOC122242244 isoform X2 [Penaeus japonicus]|nr:uncharacterized protein LOC122242244 isoform X2 [Penaeus japonicus]XP_042855432.1 uncharacterized protein LOC122242244 isoform X2 [Penaeus japonicus]XP_042855433.1 uncharacterized protein LOC122242244 isoform X2 [Penaeus japonicus]